MSTGFNVKSVIAFLKPLSEEERNRTRDYIRDCGVSTEVVEAIKQEFGW